ncbi:hypothetical protein V3G39_06435 [Dermatophilaceae bacterium Sec6.4]
MARPDAAAFLLGLLASAAVLVVVLGELFVAVLLDAVALAELADVLLPLLPLQADSMSPRARTTGTVMERVTLA